MNFHRETIKNAPSFISIPVEMRNRDVEIIILPLDEKTENGKAVETDANGYPIGFFEETAGSLESDPIERAPQGDYERRKEVK